MLLKKYATVMKTLLKNEKGKGLQNYEFSCKYVASGNILNKKQRKDEYFTNHERGTHFTGEDPQQILSLVSFYQPQNYVVCACATHKLATY